MKTHSRRFSTSSKLRADLNSFVTTLTITYTGSTSAMPILIGLAFCIMALIRVLDPIISPNEEIPWALIREIEMVNS